ncbi:MAG: helix-turn-helix domain-containing protein [Lawsonibacter sp.]
MGEMYGRIESLCSKSKITVGKMCSDLGISRGTMGDLKAGRTKKLSADNVAKIAARFSVSTDYLLTGEQTEKTPAPEGERQVDDDDIKFALFGTREIDDDVLDRVKQFAKFAQEHEKNK